MSQNTIKTIFKSGSDEERDFFLTLGKSAKSMENTANFYIRNTMSGLRKSPEERTHNETEVLHYVFTGIQKANIKKDKRFKGKLTTILSYIRCGISPMAFYGDIKEALKHAVPFEYPTMHKWFLGYEVLDAIFKETKNPVYYSMPSQMNQNAIRKRVAAWRSYFRQKKDYKVNPWKYKGRPRMPKYIKEDVATTWYSNQFVVIKDIGSKRFLDFRNGTVMVPIGKCSSSLFAGKLTKVEAIFKHGCIEFAITFDSDQKGIKEPKSPKRIMGIDPGKKNFIAVATNTGSTPFIVPGGAINAINCAFNTQKARFTSKLTKGSDSTHSVKHSKALDRISRKRDNQLCDLFYKIAHAVCRYAKREQIEVILIGHNEGQKDGINLRHEVNREFVPIPFTRFISILTVVGTKYGIFVKEREESYTSQASCLDFDDIPTYGQVKETPVFSGKRRSRGCYKTNKGISINADVNGAANLIRKEYPNAFDGVKDLSYLWKSVDVLDYRCIYQQVKKEHTPTNKKHKSGINRRFRHIAHQKKKIELMQVFDKGKKIHKPNKRPAA